VATINSQMVDLLYSEIIFLSSLNFFIRNGLRAINRLFMLVVVITILGAFTSIVFPSFFEPMAIEANATLDYEGRAFGFFLQPNTLGLALNFIMFGWYASTVPKSKKFSIVFMCLYALSIVITGSRFSIILMILIIGLIYIFFDSPGKAVFLNKLMAVTKFAAVAILIWGTVYTVFYTLGLSSLVESGNVYDRVQSLISFNVFHSGDTYQSGSLYFRLLAQVEYIDAIMQKPFFGYGIGVQSEMLSNGVLPLPAHNSALSLSFDYGILYVISITLLFFAFVFDRSSRHHVSLLKINAVLIFFAALTPVFFLNHGVIENRYFYIYLAFVLGLGFIPRQPYHRRKIQSVNGVR
jgi:hypothetical protein